MVSGKCLQSARVAEGEDAMPIYSYQCTECGHAFELLTSVARRDEALCPKCGGKVARTYRGQCAFGAKRAGEGGGAPGGGSCSGHCAGCSGCGH